MNQPNSISCKRSSLNSANPNHTEWVKLEGDYFIYFNAWTGIASASKRPNYEL